VIQFRGVGVGCDQDVEIKIWIDGDACPRPIKEIVFRASFKNKIPVCLVANSFVLVPKGPLISFVQVSKGGDVADLYIVEKVKRSDLVVTADIPLAALVVEKGAVAINPRGDLYTKDNVRERLSMRDFMESIRESGVNTGGPASHSAKDNQRFASSFNGVMTKMLRG